MTPVAQGSSEPSLTREDDFRAWYDSTLPRVYGYLLARCGDTAVAEELTQRTYIEAIGSRQTFQGRSADTTWLIGRTQSVIATSFANASDGFIQPSVCRGRSLSSRATASSSGWV